jgi:SAM-dependent methyltransferase
MLTQEYPILNPPVSGSQAPIVRVLCHCGCAVSLEGDQYTCACGAVAGHRDGSVAVVPPVAPYWGEIGQKEIMSLLNAGCASGWRRAVECLSSSMQANIMGTGRAAFQDLLPIPDGSTVLDVGAGLGCIATDLALRHRVVALEGVPERAQFIALRKAQDALRNLTVVNADLNTIRFDAAQFDAVVVNGVLEWVGLFDLSVSPDIAQLRFLRRLRTALSDRGYLYVGIENRIGWDQLSGTPDHSGLPYTSLMPRFVARWRCNRASDYRAQGNAGYRTYTYSYYGYRRLFRRAGFDIHNFWIAPRGYNLPTELVPVTPAAIAMYSAAHWCHPLSWRGTVKNAVKTALASPLPWKLFGSDFVFLLKARHDA